MKASGDLLSDVWARIERVLAVHAPEVLQTLAVGASSAQIAELEAQTRLTFPPDLRRSLELHDGQKDPSQCLKFCGTMSLLSTGDMIREWKMLTELGIGFDRDNGEYDSSNNSLNGDWWRLSCIPFGHCEGYYSCVDTLAAEHLPAGRIVEHTHDGPMEETNMPSFADWLERVAIALEAGRFDRNLRGFFSVYPEFNWRE